MAISWAADIRITDLQGHAENPFRSSSHVRVLLFVRTDCPITNRYAPELQRLAAEFHDNAVQFWLIYSDRTEKAESIQRQVTDYRFPGTPLLDPQQILAKRAGASVAPEAAVFDGAGHLCYRGRIDDRWLDLGKSRPVAARHDLEEAIAVTLAGKPVRLRETKAIGCSLADLR